MMLISAHAHAMLTKSDGYTFGSLWRPPEICLDFFSWSKSIATVYSWLQLMLSKNVGYESLEFRGYIGGIVAIWQILEARYIHKEGKLRLAQFMQNHDCDILRRCFELYLEDCCVFLHLESLVSKGDLMKLLHVDGLRALAPYISAVFDGLHTTALADLAFWRNAHRERELRLDVCKQLLEYGIDNRWLVVMLAHHVSPFTTQSLELFSKECKKGSLIQLFHLCKFTQLSLFIKILVGCSVRLLVSVGERFKQEVYPHTSQDVLCVDFVSKSNIPRNPHIVAVEDQLLLWFVIFLPLVKKETSFFSSWLVYNERHIPSRCVPSQGEFRSTFRFVALLLKLLWLSLVYPAEQQMVKQFQLYLRLIRSQEGAAIYMLKELFSVTSTWSLLEFILPTTMHNSIDDEDFARRWTVFDVGCEVFLQGQRGDCFFPYFSHKLEHNFSKLQSLFGLQIGACIIQFQTSKVHMDVY